MKCTEARAFGHVLSFCLHRNSKWIGHLHSLCPLTLAAQLLAPSVSKTKGLLQRMAFHLAVFRLLSMGWTWTGMPQAKVLHTSWCWDLYTSLHAITCCYMSLHILYTATIFSPCYWELQGQNSFQDNPKSRSPTSYLSGQWLIYAYSSVSCGKLLNKCSPDTSKGPYQNMHMVWYHIWYVWINMIWSANMCIDIRALHNDM